MKTGVIGSIAVQTSGLFPLVLSLAPSVLCLRGPCWLVPLTKEVAS